MRIIIDHETLKEILWARYHHDLRASSVARCRLILASELEGAPPKEVVGIEDDPNVEDHPLTAERGE